MPTVRVCQIGVRRNFFFLFGGERDLAEKEEFSYLHTGTSNVHVRVWFDELYANMYIRSLCQHRG